MKSLKFLDDFYYDILFYYYLDDFYFNDEFLKLSWYRI